MSLANNSTLKKKLDMLNFTKRINIRNKKLKELYFYENNENNKKLQSIKFTENINNNKEITNNISKVLKNSINNNKNNDNNENTIINNNFDKDNNSVYNNTDLNIITQKNIVKDNLDNKLNIIENQDNYYIYNNNFDDNYLSHIDKIQLKNYYTKKKLQESLIKSISIKIKSIDQVL